MSANMNAVSIASPEITQAEFQMKRAELEQFAHQVLGELFGNHDAELFRLQIQAHATPPTGATARINKGDDVTVTVHPRA